LAALLSKLGASDLYMAQLRRYILSGHGSQKQKNPAAPAMRSIRCRRSIRGGSLLPKQQRRTHGRALRRPSFFVRYVGESEGRVMGADMGTPEGLALQRRFMRHVVGIYCEFRENEVRRQVLYTGFIFSVEEQWMLITAGHCITDIEQIRASLDVHVGAWT
jgi:hypothetical protein